MTVKQAGVPIQVRSEYLPKMTKELCHWPASFPLKLQTRAVAYKLIEMVK
jgi:hypothetical protein